MLCAFIPHIVATFFATDPEIQNWTGWVPTLVLPALGIAIVLFCLASFRFPYGDKLVAVRQMIKGYGLDLQVSLLTVFLLIGVGLSLSGVGIYLLTSARDVTALNTQIVQLKSDLEKAKKDVERATKMDLSVILKLPQGLDPKTLNNRSLRCHYVLNEQESDQQVSFAPSGALKCPILDVKRGDIVEELTLEETSAGRVEVLANAREPFHPLQPQINLEPPKKSAR